MGSQIDVKNAALVGAAMLLVSCTSRDDEPSFACETVAAGGGESIDGAPTLVEARMVDRATVRLVFSEAMGPVDDVDPSAFRLSLAGANVGDLYGTMYNDLAYIGSVCPPMAGADECCYELCTNYDCEQMCVPATPPLRVVGVCSDGSDPRVLTLHLGVEVDMYTCQFVTSLTYLSEMYGRDYGGGIFVHYTDKKIPVADAQGERLAPIAEHWALTEEAMAHAMGSFPAMDPWLPIACPG